MAELWCATIEGPELEQGDLILGVRFLSALREVTYVNEETDGRTRQPIWRPRNPPARDDRRERSILASALAYPALVVAHGCDIDKDYKKLCDEGKKRVLCAPVEPIAKLGKDEGEARRYNVASSFPLIGLPQLGDSFAVLRSMQPISAVLLTQARVWRRMTEEHRVKLRGHLIAFFSDRMLPTADGDDTGGPSATEPELAQ